MSDFETATASMAAPSLSTTTTPPPPPPPGVKVEQVEQVVGPEPAMTDNEDIKVDVKPDVGVEVKSDMLSIFSPSSPRPARSPDDDNKLGAYDSSNENAVASSSRTPFSDDDEHGSSSSSTPAPTSRRSKKSSKIKGLVGGPTQLIDHLPRVEDEALATFDVLSENTFEKKHLGRSNQQEDMMICDCVFNPNTDDPLDACGIRSNCINRLTQVECLRDECPTRGNCRNQRFSRKQYADVEVVMTEKKGFGLRAGKDLPQETFIYEYIGEVVSQPTFMKRMKSYADEGIKHFYFMMLQREEYIDATKKGGIARFANHSCNPNCYVAKWVVGKRMRMGIFAKRDIQQGEELTFNYNVDRYGHTAQICYCGEPNCVGTIGGKTQTDIGGMDDLFIDALGIADQVEALELRGNKKKKGKKLDEDFVPVMKPIDADEVPKVVAALRQATGNRLMMVKLLERIKITTDADIQRQLMLTHGFSLMWTVLMDHGNDDEVAVLVLHALAGWTPSKRNKIEDSKIEEPIRACLESSEDETVLGLASQLLEKWSTLPLDWRIPRKIRIADAEDDKVPEEAPYTPPARPAWAISSSTSSSTLHQTEHKLPEAKLKPRGLPPPGSFRPRSERHGNSWRAGADPATTPAKTSSPAAASKPIIDSDRLEAILQQAKSNQETIQSASSTPVKRDLLDEEEGRSAKRLRTSSSSSSSEREARQRHLTKYIGEQVVRSMTKYREFMERETFKAYAKECTQILMDKEKKKEGYLSHPIRPLSDEKKAKIKSFVKAFAHKVLKKLKERGKLRKPPPSDRTDAEQQAVNLGEQDAMVQDMFGSANGDDDVDTEMEPLTNGSVDTMEDGNSPAVKTPETVAGQPIRLAAVSEDTPMTPPRGFTKGGFLPVA